MIRKAAASILVGATFSCAAAVLMAQGRPRARELGVAPGIHPPGPLNAITDVGGVRVGHTTVIEGDAVRTGVTAVLPHAGNIFQEKVAGAVFVGNAFGKLAGSTQVAGCLQLVVTGDDGQVAIWCGRGDSNRALA